MAWSKTIRSEHVRIGPITVLTLVTVICLAVLAVLAISTAHATSVLTQRQAESTQELYQDEIAAQLFVAEVDARLAPVRLSGGSEDAGIKAVQKDLDAIQEAVVQDQQSISITPYVEGDTVRATISGASGRTLTVVLAVQADASYVIEQWKMSAIQNDEQPMGNLWSGN